MIDPNTVLQWAQTFGVLETLGVGAFNKFKELLKDGGATDEQLAAMDADYSARIARRNPPVASENASSGEAPKEGGTTDANVR